MAGWSSGLRQQIYNLPGDVSPRGFESLSRRTSGWKGISLSHNHAKITFP